MTGRLIEQEDKVELREYCGQRVHNIFKLKLSMRAIPIALMLNSSPEEGKTGVV
jgi:hypothetical protein